MTEDQYFKMKGNISSFLEREFTCSLQFDESGLVKLSDARKGRSETLNNGEGKEKAAKNWNAAESFVREKRGLLSAKDLYVLFKNINYILINGDEQNADGQLPVSAFRTSDVNFRDAKNADGRRDGNNINIQSIIPPQIVSVVYSVMDSIASRMKNIEQIEDENKKKGAAISLAAMAYEVLLSTHAFDDGNGRTCRLFSDYILLKFGLPPAVPAEFTISKSLQESQMDFEGARNGYELAVRRSVELMNK